MATGHVVQRWDAATPRSGRPKMIRWPQWSPTTRGLDLRLVNIGAFREKPGE